MKKLCLSAVLMFGASLAHADMKPHVYLGASLGKAEASDADLDDTSFGVTGGYYFNQNFRAEVNYVDLGEDDNVSASAVSAVLMAALPVNETLSLFARAGFANVSVDVDTIFGSDSESEFDITYGVGALIRVARSLDISMSYDMFYFESDFVDVDIDRIALGINYHFD